MNQKEYQKFVSYLVENYKVYSPREEKGQIIIQELFDAKKTAPAKKLPFYPWKKFFVPEEETMFEYADSKLTKPVLEEDKKITLLNVNILDLRAVLLYDLVFANDPYYQARRENILIIGFGPEVELQDGTIRKIEENDLARLPFDLFLYDTGKIKVFSASEKGKKILDETGYKNYEEVKFLGHKDNDFLEGRKNLRRDKLKNRHNQKIWDELGKICLECGKCTLACPTCFCFRIDDFSKLGTNCGTRQRCWDSCFYQEFSEIAGERKFLNNTAQRIHFWYFHKFARIPDEYNMMGCVGCGRCHTVCPVEINIKEVLEQIEKS